MASIIEVKGKWRAQVRRRGVPSYTRTFTTKAAAERWARQLEADIDRQREGSAPAGPVAGAASGRVVLVADLIQAYRDLRDQARPISDASTEHYTLKHLAHHLGARDALRRMVPTQRRRWCAIRASGRQGCLHQRPRIEPAHSPSPSNASANNSLMLTS